MPAISPTLTLILAIVAILIAAGLGWWLFVERPSRQADAAIEPDYTPRHREPGSLEREAAAAADWSEDWTDDQLGTLAQAKIDADLATQAAMRDHGAAALLLTLAEQQERILNRDRDMESGAAAWPDVLFDGPAALDKWLSGRPLAATPWVDR